MDFALHLNFFLKKENLFCIVVNYLLDIDFFFCFISARLFIWTFLKTKEKFPVMQVTTSFPCMFFLYPETNLNFFKHFLQHRVIQSKKSLFWKDWRKRDVITVIELNNMNTAGASNVRTILTQQEIPYITIWRCTQHLYV